MVGLTPWTTATHSLREWVARGRAIGATRRELFDRVKNGKKDRTGRALVAVAHRMLRIMVAMLKSGEAWRPPEVEVDAKEGLTKAA